MRMASGLVLLGVVALAACGAGTEQQAPSKVTIAGVELGRAVNKDETMRDATVVFKSQDATIWASVATESDGPGTLEVRWVAPGGRTLGEEKRKIDAAGRTSSAFKLRTPGRGRFTFQAFADGSPPRSLEFTVQP